MDLNTVEKEIKEIGRGRRSVVRLVEKNFVKMARKEIDVSRLPPEEIKSITEEINLLSELRDRCVLIYKENRYDFNQKKYYIYTEYLENGDLCHLIQKQSAKGEYFDEKIIRNYTEDIARALKYIHSKGIIHRDLKPANIFIGNHNELIIGDFGIAVKRDDKEVKLIGTAGYIAPELWVNNPPIYTPASDIFSFGCILYEIYTFQMAFVGETNIKIRDLILNPNYQISFNRNPSIPVVEQLIKRMLERNPLNRISLDEIFTTTEQWKSGINMPLNNSIENICSLGETIIDKPNQQPIQPFQQQSPYHQPFPSLVPPQRSFVSPSPPPPLPPSQPQPLQHQQHQLLYQQQYQQLPISQPQPQQPLSQPPQPIPQQQQHIQQLQFPIQQQQYQQQSQQQPNQEQLQQHPNKFIKISDAKKSAVNQTPYSKLNIQQQQVSSLYQFKHNSNGVLNVYPPPHLPQTLPPSSDQLQQPKSPHLSPPLSPSSSSPQKSNKYLDIYNNLTNIKNLKDSAYHHSPSPLSPRPTQS